tara:strand:+ start:439 stop:684 length:246 start_codon:yes stop_codon:yes gene_type:complete
MEFQIPEKFVGFADVALTRLHYLYPELKISFLKDTFYIEVENSNQDINLEKELKKEIFHQLYRAKIYEDTLPIKKWLFSDK